MTQEQATMPPKAGKKTNGGGAVGRALMRKHQQQGPAVVGALEQQQLDGRKQLSSVLEMNSLDDFLDTAMMAQRDFSAIKERDLLVLDAKTGGLTSILPRGQVTPGTDKGMTTFAFRQLKVPRRPKWHTGMSAAALDRAEKASFLEWRREIAQLEETSGERAKVTPFEKNLEVWRQLWRVLERSHVIVQIVDARDPLFYYSEDLHAYAAEMHPARECLVLVNKADYLTPAQRGEWAAYFQKRGWNHAFFSARSAQELLTVQARKERLKELEGRDGEEEEEEEEEEGEEEEEEEEEEKEEEEAGEEEEEGEERIRRRKERGGGEEGEAGGPSAPVKVSCSRGEKEEEPESKTTTFPPILTRTELIARLKGLAARVGGAFAAAALEAGHAAGKPTVGMVGFPNVGKSSVINVLMGVTPLEHDRVRVAVSSTPGKTKHFQTLPLDPETMLCDCPGLVFPSFVATTADMVCAGVLPINQLREHMAPVELLCRRLPGPLLRRAYGLKEQAKDGEETPAWASAKESGGSSSGCETARTFLGDLCGARGYWTQGSGVADVNRAARMVLRDYVEGRLVYSHPPPGLTAEEGRAFEAATRGRGGGKGPGLSEGLRRLSLGEGRDKEEGGGMGAGKGGGSGSRGGQQGEVEGLGEEGEEEAELVGLEGEEEEASTVGEGSRSGKVRVRPTKRWGKKGKKLRNKTPYEDTEGGVGGRAPGGGARVLGRKVVGGGEGGFTRVTMPHFAGRV